MALTITTTNDYQKVSIPIISNGYANTKRSLFCKKAQLLIFIAIVSFLRSIASSPPLVKVPQIGIITNAHPSGCIVMSSACLASRGMGMGQKGF